MSKLTVSTDLQDYAPGSTVTITASGFTLGTAVMFEVDHANGDDSGTGHTPWYVTDGGAGDLDGVANGVIRTSWYVDPDDSLGATFLLTARTAGRDGAFGTADDRLASTVFTDAGSVTATGSTVTLDESAGLQNVASAPGAPGDADDNDIGAASLPSAFSGRLSALGAGTAINAALSGYAGMGSGSNAFTIDAGGTTVTDVRFVDGTGALLNGVDSELRTVDGTQIYLYSDSTNNNIVLGRAGNNAGPIVLAAYIEETGTPVSGGKIWTVQYSPLQNPVASNPDDPVDLTNKLYVGTTQNLQFDLASAPSGQNLFLMFTQKNPHVDVGGGVLRITDPAIIATGKDPANQSLVGNITTGDTINTSQAGGPTTFGTNNQMVVVGEGLRFSFVTGARQDVTIPNLDQNEADVEANIDFTGVFNVKSASFDVVQLQSGKSAVLKITAYSTAAEPGVNFIDGYAGDATVAIAAVTVNGAAPATGTATVSGGVWTISGIKAGDKLEYTTATDHNRVLIENAGSGKGQASAAFDLGGFMLTQVSSAKAGIGSKMIFEDDGPSIGTTGAEPALTVDETMLTTDATASFAANFTSAFGADGAGTLTYALGVVAGASGLTDTATGEAVNLSLTGGGVVQGKTATSGLVVFEVKVDGAGNVTLDQQRAVVHADPGDPNDSKTLASDNLVTLTATKTDKDGDSAQAVLGIGQNLSFLDDGPSVAFGNLVGTGTVNPQYGYWNNSVGADTPGNLDMALTSFTIVPPGGGTPIPGDSFAFSELV